MLDHRTSPFIQKTSQRIPFKRSSLAIEFKRLHWQLLRHFRLYRMKCHTPQLQIILLKLTLIGIKTVFAFVKVEFWTHDVEVSTKATPCKYNGFQCNCKRKRVSCYYLQVFLKSCCSKWNTSDCILCEMSIC